MDTHSRTRIEKNNFNSTVRHVVCFIVFSIGKRSIILVQQQAVRPQDLESFQFRQQTADIIYEELK